MPARHSLNRRRFSALLGAAAAGPLFAPGAARAGDTLDMVTIVLGVPAGSMVDHIARQVGEILKNGYAANAMIENRTGASGILAVAAAKSAPADGSTVLVAAPSPITVYPSTYKKLPYNPQTDLIPVSTVVISDLALAVGPAVPPEVTNLKQYFAWCRANPDKSDFGSPASGSMPHFLGSMTARAAGVNLLHVPYRGPGPAVIDMMGGRVSAAVVPLVDVLEFSKIGRCRILAVTGEKRSRFAPQAMTFAEQGFGEYAMRVWIGAFVPAGTPAAMVAKLSERLKVALNDKAIVAGLESNAQEVEWCSPAQLQQRIESERAKWAVAVKALNFTSNT